MPRQALARRPERVNLVRAAEITGQDINALKAAASRGDIPGAAQLSGRSWTFDLNRLCSHFGQPALPPTNVYQLDNPATGGLDRQQAAAHLGLGAEDFNSALILGQIPLPVVIRDRELWPVQNLRLRKRPPQAGDRYAGVYVVGFQDYIKIGISSDLTQRLAAIQDGIPEKLVVHQIFIGEGRSCELRLHECFSKYRIRGEWFWLDGDLHHWIKDGCR